MFGTQDCIWIQCHCGMQFGDKNLNCMTHDENLNDLLTPTTATDGRMDGGYQLYLLSAAPNFSFQIWKC